MSTLGRLDALLEDAKQAYQECIDSGEMPISCGLAIGHALTGVSFLVQQAIRIHDFEARKQARQATHDQHAADAQAKKFEPSY